MLRPLLGSCMRVMNRKTAPDESQLYLKVRMLLIELTGQWLSFHVTTPYKAISLYSKFISAWLVWHLTS